MLRTMLNAVEVLWGTLNTGQPLQTNDHVDCFVQKCYQHAESISITHSSETNQSFVYFRMFDIHAARQRNPALHSCREQRSLDLLTEVQSMSASQYADLWRRQGRWVADLTNASSWLGPVQLSKAWAEAIFRSGPRKTKQMVRVT